MTSCQKEIHSERWAVGVRRKRTVASSEVSRPRRERRLLAGFRCLGRALKPRRVTNIHSLRKTRIIKWGEKKHLKIFTVLLHVRVNLSPGILLFNNNKKKIVKCMEFYKLLFSTKLIFALSHEERGTGV